MALKLIPKHRSDKLCIARLDLPYPGQTCNEACYNLGWNKKSTRVVNVDLKSNKEGYVIHLDIICLKCIRGMDLQTKKACHVILIVFLGVDESNFSTRLHRCYQQSWIF